MLIHPFLHRHHVPPSLWRVPQWPSGPQGKRCPLHGSRWVLCPFIVLGSGFLFGPAIWDITVQPSLSYNNWISIMKPNIYEPYLHRAGWAGGSGWVWYLWLQEPQDKDIGVPDPHACDGPGLRGDVSDSRCGLQPLHAAHPSPLPPSQCGREEGIGYQNSSKKLPLESGVYAALLL